MAITIKMGVQLANNLAAEIESDDVSEAVQALQDIAKALEANMAPQGQQVAGTEERKGLIIPEVQVRGPIREEK